jgi:hypothetical protein
VRFRASKLLCSVRIVLYERGLPQFESSNIIVWKKQKAFVLNFYAKNSNSKIDFRI